MRDQLTHEGTTFVPTLHAINFLDGGVYEHHPVMQQVPNRIYPLERHFLTEWNGLRVPARLDCDIFNNDTHFGNHFYFFEVPTRWHACRLHHAALLAGVTFTVPTLPYVDDEYHEQVAVYHSVLRAVAAWRQDRSRKLVFAELGARWGTWGARAIAFGRQLAPSMGYRLYLAESRRENCAALRETMAKNSIAYRLKCAKASAPSLNAWINEMGYVDAMDWDIQGAESSLLNETWHAIERRVHRLIIGTHSDDIHAEMRRHFDAHGWRTVWEVPRQHSGCFSAIKRHLRGEYRTPDIPQRFDWAALLRARAVGDPRRRCTQPSPRGPIANWDGEIIVDNPRFVNFIDGFSMVDKVLKADDLRYEFASRGAVRPGKQVGPAPP